ncbi:unnamed protein product, partial [Notodromas monacha]
VAICAGCNILPTWAAFLVGIGSAIVFLTIKRIMDQSVVVDDPLDAVAVHFGGGMLAWNVIGTATITFWSLGTTGLMCAALKYTNVLRVSKQEELKGMDEMKHQEPAYPIESWVEDQYKNHGFILPLGGAPNTAGTLAIAVWSFVLTGLLCGIMKYTHLLRIGEEEEIKGLDVAKHEEPAYPVESWLEDQYIKHDSILPLGGASVSSLNEAILPELGKNGGGGGGGSN